MIKKKHNTTKKVCIVAGTVFGAGAAVAAWCFGHKPSEGINCIRSVMRADGVPKKPFGSAARANLQSVWQYVRYGEKCHAYKIGEKFYTGHRR